MRALKEHPDRFFGSVEVDPTQGMDARPLPRRRWYETYGIKAATTFPAGVQVPINDKRYYPIYAKCVELDIPIFVCAGIPGPRVPFAPQRVELIDEVCYVLPRAHLRDAPRRRAVDRAGREAHAQVAEPLLLHLRVRPEALPDGTSSTTPTRAAPTRSSTPATSPPGSPTTASGATCPNVPFKDEVWPKFLRENARKVLKLA